MTETWETNKAKLVEQDGVVTKTYFKNGDAEKDYQLLKMVEDNFKPQTLNDWYFRPLKVYGCDNDSLKMEMVNGVSLQAEKQLNDKFSFFGTWLGLMHAATETSRGVITFNDYNLSNVMLSVEDKVVIGLDPGGYDQIYSSPAVSFVVGAFSIWRHCLRSKRSPVKPIRYYADSYFDCYPANSNLKFECDVGIDYLLKRLNRKASRNLINKPSFISKLVNKVEVLVLLTLLKMVSEKSL